MEIDNDNEDPQLCASLACDIYNHLRLAEVSLHKIIGISLFKVRNMYDLIEVIQCFSLLIEFATEETITQN
jgi:hypothetical protein